MHAHGKLKARMTTGDVIVYRALTVADPSLSNIVSFHVHVFGDGDERLHRFDDRAVGRLLSAAVDRQPGCELIVIIIFPATEAIAPTELGYDAPMDQFVCEGCSVHLSAKRV
jgi:hypothetical protein